MGPTNSIPTPSPNLPPEHSQNLGMAPDLPSQKNPVSPTSSPNDENNKILSIVLTSIIFIVILVSIGIIVFKAINGDIFPKNTSEDSAEKTTTKTIDSTTHPTPELAKSVCEKHGGELEANGNVNFHGTNGRYCVNKEDGSVILPNGISFIIGFMEEDEKDEIWSEIRTTISDSEGHEDVSGYTILEDYDNFVKASSIMGGILKIYLVAYDDAVVEISVTRDSSTTDRMLAELGFPTD